MKICVLGAGALGSAIGGTLAEAGSDVTLIDRNPAHVDAINRDGLRLRDGDIDRTVRVKAALDCRGLPLRLLWPQGRQRLPRVDVALDRLGSGLRIDPPR